MQYEPFTFVISLKRGRTTYWFLKSLNHTACYIFEVKCVTATVTLFKCKNKTPKKFVVVSCFGKFVPIVFCN